MKSKEYIPALTGVRAIAAYLVFFHHFNQTGFSYPLFRMLNEFHMGVTLFFVLSGFLIGLRYYDTCEITSTWFRKYIKNRIARIYPMYLILTLATFIVGWIMKDNAIFGTAASPMILLLFNIFFLRGFFDELKFTGVSQGWSLTVEECFYFLAPFFFMQIKKTRKAFIYLPILFIGMGCILVIIFSHINFLGFFGNFRFMFLYTFFGRCIEFFYWHWTCINYFKKQRINRQNTFIYLAWFVDNEPLCWNNGNTTAKPRNGFWIVPTSRYFCK